MLLNSVAQVLRTKTYRNAAEWAENSRILGRSESSEAGPFNASRTPYFQSIYEAAESGKYRWIIVVCGSQMGKTEFMLNRCGYRFDVKPVPLMIVQPNKDLAKRFSKARVAKLIRNTPPLWGKLAKGSLDNIFEKYIGGTQLKIAWATSATQLCSDPAGEVHLDELDRMSDDVDGEGDPVTLSDARGATFPDFLLIACSTPTVEGESKIMKLFEMGTQQVWCAPCPHCGHFFAPFFADLHWEEGATAGRARKTAFVQCPECKRAIGDEWRIEANRPGVGRYLAPGQSVEVGKIVGNLKETHVASFRVPGLFSPWVSFGESAALWVDADASGDATKIKTVINTRFGDLYKIEGDAPRTEELEVLRSDTPSLVIPPWALLLVAGCDVQKRGLYVVVRAYGPGGKSQAVLFLFLPGDTNEDQVWLDLEKNVLDYPFGDAKKPMFISRMAIDSRYREEMVFAFVSRHKDRCLAARGQAQQSVPVRVLRIEITFEGKRKAEGIQLLSINDSHFKLFVFNRITRGADVEDAWLIAQDMSEEYCEQVLSEELVILPSGRHKWVQRRKDNHALDCEKFNAALAHWLNFRLLREISERQAPPQRQVRQSSQFQEI